MTKRTIGELKESAREVLASVQDLTQVYLASARLVTHDHEQQPPFHTDTNVQLKFERGTDEVLEVWAKYTTSVTKADDDDESAEPKPVWTIELECVAEYELAVGAAPGSGACEAFAVLVGSTALHPYARDWTQQLSSQSRYPAFTLGMLRNIAELDDDHEVEFPETSDDDGA